MTACIQVKYFSFKLFICLNVDRSSVSSLWTSHLKRAIAKDLGEDWGGEVGDDREQDRHPGCVQEDEEKVAVMGGYDQDRCFPKKIPSEMEVAPRYNC